jgi:molecular chaperone GrpE
VTDRRTGRSPKAASPPTGPTGDDAPDEQTEVEEPVTQHGTATQAPDDISGVDNFIEEGAPLEPSDLLDDDLAEAVEVPDAAQLQQALAERTADLQRIQAEYVNYKRRVDRDRELVKQNAVFAVLTGLLPVLDDIDRAREHGEVEGGFKAVADALERSVAAHGLVKFGEPGDEFDPRLHEALMHAHSPDVSTTTCQDIVSAGYRIGERVVRPARVTVVDPEPGATQ